jgi:hypothetical protein
MAYKQILVHIKTNEEWSPHIDYAFGIASHFAARIVGVHGSSLPDMSQYPASNRERAAGS